MSDDITRATGSAIAGGAIAGALLEALVAKDILTIGEGRDVLSTALRAVSQHNRTPPGQEAMQIIGILQTRLSARG